MDLEEYIPEKLWPKPPKGIRFERLDKSHAEAANNLFNEVFQQQRPLEHYLWKFWENPAGPPYGYVAIDEETGAVLSSNIGLRKKVWVNGSEEEAILLCESATSPNARSGGRIYKGVTISTGLGAATDEQIPFAYGGQSTDEAIKIGKRWFGYRVVFALKVWEQRLSFRPSLLKRLGFCGRCFLRIPFLLSLLDSIGRLSWKKREPSPYVVSEETTIGPEFDALWKKDQNLYSLCFSRSAATLRWRFCDCPVGEHFFLTARKEGSLVGYLALRKWFEGETPVATILDCWHGNQEDVLCQLLDKARFVAREKRCDFLRFAVKDNSLGARAMQSLGGFRLSPYCDEDRIISTPLPIPVEDATSHHYSVQREAVQGEKWFYTQGDCDFLD